MKINYNQIMHKQISQLQSKPKLLLHVCCAPCSSGVLPKLEQFFDITLFYYNPNTYPETEYNLRAEQFCKFTSLPIIIHKYNHNEFLEIAKEFCNEIEGGIRCQKCIKLRMEQSFKYAKMNNFDYITTTLSISPHKNAELINLCGGQLEKEYKVKYLYADFKKDNGYLNSIKYSKEYQLYRQEYCGCEFSINKTHN